MTKKIINQQKQCTNLKKGSRRPKFKGNLAQGLNRRAFLKVGGSATLSAALGACAGEETNNSPSQSHIPPPATEKASDSFKQTPSFFNAQQRLLLETVQQHLFPDDGNGPDAKAINAYAYLEFALTDQKNIDDGDPDFILRGLGWLEDLAEQSKGASFLSLSTPNQEDLLKRIASSAAGENWLSLLIYYITEALMLDPIYGANPEQVGWRWLEHQAGFPRPVAGKTYRDLE